MRILAVNAGSTSLKFKLCEMPEYRTMAECRIERVGSDRARFRFRRDESTWRELETPVADYIAGIRLFLNYLGSTETIDAIGFKTVLAKGYPGVHRLTDAVLDGMRAYLSVAPAHNGPYLKAIEVFRRLMPSVPQVGVFETDFHRTIPLERRLYALPYAWYETYGIQKMGYHGASHGYVARTLAGYRRVISCHLGGSGSICAILDGKSVDTSFGFSLQTGIPHASRAGDTDAYIVPYLLGEGLSLREILDGFGKNGGLKGISGTSGDLRDVERAEDAGERRAALAMDLYASSVARYIGAFAVELEGVDALAFTGGIGEHSARMRANIASRLKLLGVKLALAANRRGDALISAPDSAVSVCIVPADEEFMVAEKTYARLSRDSTGEASARC